MPSVFLELATSCRVTGRPVSSAALRVGTGLGAEADGVESLSQTNIGHEVSPSTHQGTLWHPAQEFASGQNTIEVPREDERSGKI